MPTQLPKLTLNQRTGRAVWHPVTTVRWIIWLWPLRARCYPKLSMFETMALAEKHTHNWIWGYIAYGACYLPKNRLRQD